MLVRTTRLLRAKPFLGSQSQLRALTLSAPPLNVQPSEPNPSVEPGHAGPPNPAPSTTASKAKSIVSSILHGSEKAKTEVADTHSKLLARGKYVHELQSTCGVIFLQCIVAFDLLVHDRTQSTV